MEFGASAMPYELRRLNRFLREFDKLTAAEQQEVLRALEALIAHLNSRQPLPKGLGIKKLTRSFWEARAGLQLRIVYSIDAGLIRLITVGNHNDVERFLRNL
jgi:mRNA-degrading endonuclease YafQ of YafQ-DinJ toxin-antitoxin module